MITPELVDEIAMAIYCDSYTQYGSCTPERWKKTSEDQRAFFRSQSTSVLSLLVSKGLLKNDFKI